MKIAILGCGGMGSVHYNSLRQLSETQPDVQVTALADCRPEFLQKAAAVWPGAETYPTAQALLEKAEADVVHICLPSYLHTQYAIKAMEKGCSVLLEKPACLTEEDCRRLEACQKKTGARVMVGQVLRSFDEYRFLRDACQKGTYGALQSITMQRISGNVGWGFEDWFHDAEKSGSVVMDLHIHDADFLRWMLGEPDAVQVVQATAFADGMVNHVTTSYRFGGVTALATGHWDISAALPFVAAYRAQFEGGTIVYDGSQTETLHVYLPDGTVQRPSLLNGDSKKDTEGALNIADRGPYFEEIRYFIDCVREKKAVHRAPLSDALQSVRLAGREYEQAKRLCAQAKEHAL